MRDKGKMSRIHPSSRIFFLFPGEPPWGITLTMTNCLTPLFAFGNIFFACACRLSPAVGVILPFVLASEGTALFNHRTVIH